MGLLRKISRDEAEENPVLKFAKFLYPDLLPCEFSEAEKIVSREVPMLGLKLKTEIFQLRRARKETAEHARDRELWVSLWKDKPVQFDVGEYHVHLKTRDGTPVTAREPFILESDFGKLNIRSFPRSWRSWITEAAQRLGFPEKLEVGTGDTFTIAGQSELVLFAERR